MRNSKFKIQNSLGFDDFHPIDLDVVFDRIDDRGRRVFEVELVGTVVGGANGFARRADARPQARRLDFHQRDEAVDRVVRTLGVHLGPDEILLTLGLKFRPGYEVEEAAAAVERIEKKIRAEDPRVTRVFVEPETPGDPGGLGTPF